MDPGAGLEGADVDAATAGGSGAATAGGNEDENKSGCWDIPSCIGRPDSIPISDTWNLGRQAIRIEDAVLQRYHSGRVHRLDPEVGARFGSGSWIAQ